jgi:hypothetical protein
MGSNDVGRTALMMVKDRDHVDVIHIPHDAERQHETAGCGARNPPDMPVVTVPKRDRTSSRHWRRREPLLRDGGRSFPCIAPIGTNMHRSGPPLLS